jgi:hypothetical protein
MWKRTKESKVISIRGERARLLVVLLGVVFGSVFAGAGWWLHVKQQPFPDGVTTQAKVTDVSTNYGTSSRNKTRSYASGYTRRANAPRDDLPRGVFPGSGGRI